jgi:hypothetical protein
VDVCEYHPIYESFGIDPQTRFLFDSDFCAVEKLLRSDAWAMLPDIVIKTYSTKIKTLKFPSSWNAPYTVNIIIRRDRSNNLVLSKLREVLSSEKWN